MINFQFNGDLRRAPTPRSPRCDALRADLAQRLGVEIVIDPARDFEDWTECAVQLQVVLNSGADLEVEWHEKVGVTSVPNPVFAFYEDAGNEVPEDAGPECNEVPEYELCTVPVTGWLCADATLGTLGDHDLREAQEHGHVWPNPAEMLTVKRYAETLTFQKHAGRRLILCDMPGGDPSHTYRTLPPMAGTGEKTHLRAALAQFPGKEVAVKQVLPLKSMPVRFVRVDATDLKATEREIFVFDPYHVLNYEGDRDVLLVQEKITMTHETRYFVINGEPVSGGGCIESHTPLDRDPAQVHGVTHAVFETLRNSGEVVTDPDTAARLEAFVRTVAADLRAECPDVDHAVIDVALDGNGTPIVIEMNPMQNSGLYANDPALIFGPIADRIIDLAPEEDTPSL